MQKDRMQKDRIQKDRMQKDKMQKDRKTSFLHFFVMKPVQDNFLYNVVQKGKRGKRIEI